MTAMSSHAREVAAGAALGLAAVLVALVLKGSQHTVLAAVFLAAIGAVYFGFAVADGRPSAIAIQAASATCFAVLAYAGVRQGSDAFLGAGFAAHAAWDMLHHEGRGPTRVRSWYPPFCATVDLVIAVPLLAGWL